jgi:Tol biopolymer transport system component
MRGRAESATWVSDSSVATIIGQQLRILGRNSLRPRTVSLPFPAFALKWSPQHRILRFTLADHAHDTQYLWQIKGTDGQPEPVSFVSSGACCGSWSADGQIYVFLVKDGLRYDIWALRDPPDLATSIRSKPFRITSGPVNYHWPVASPNGSAVFAIGEMMRGELVRYDFGDKEFKPFANGIRGLEADFATDGTRLTYSSYPERTLWTARADGGDPIQLTFPPMAAVQPHWSPDLKQIAFMGQLPDKPRRVYVISAEGGAPVEVGGSSGHQGVPTWSADGSKIVYGDLMLGRAAKEMRIHVVDLKSKVVSDLPESEGLWSPRWSPDGRYIVAMTSDFHELRMFDTSTQSWRGLAAAQNLDFPIWSKDCRSIFFKATGMFRPYVGTATASIYRLDLGNDTVHKLLSLDGFEETDIPWYGVTPEGAPLALRAVRVEEIFSLPVR